MSDTLFFFEDGWDQTNTDDISQILDDILQDAGFQETDNTSALDNLERHSSPSSGSTTKR